MPRRSKRNRSADPNSANRLPKTYPSNAPPIFTVQHPIVGLRPDEVSKLTHAIHDEAQRKKGEEMVFQVNLEVIVVVEFALSHSSDRLLRKGVDGGQCQAANRGLWLVGHRDD